MAEPDVPIKAIVSDFGGVLTTPLVESFISLQDEIGVSPEHFGKAMRTLTEEAGENPLYAMERGEISEEPSSPSSADGLEPLLDHTPSCTASARCSSAGCRSNTEMIELMRELKGRGLRMAMLTNNVREWEAMWRSMLPVDEIFETRRRLRLRRLPQARTADLRDHPGAARPARRGLPLHRRHPRQLRGGRSPGPQRGPLPRQRAGDRRDPAPRSPEQRGQATAGAR